MTPASVSIHRSCLSSVYILVLPFFFISLAQTSAGYRGTVHINTTLTGLDRLIQNHRAICRLSDSCATMDKTDPLRTCCKPCSCEMSCFAERTCCPEVLTEFWEEPEAEIKPECMKPAFRIPSDAVYYSIDSAFMISKCPDDFDDKGIKEKCERRNGNALEDQLPVTVTDNDRTVTFANKYCAECHLVPKEKLINWIVRVECKESTFNFWSKASLLADVEATNDCYLVFQPISSDHHKKCFNGISKCNITGEWKIYDNFTDRACQLYTAPFLEYINPFCAVCNGLDANRMAQYEMADCSAGRRPPMNWVPFSALISMDSLVMADSNEHVAKRKNFAKRDNCSQNQIYDAYVGKCRDVYCGIGRILKEGRCISAFSVSRGICYKVFIKIKPILEKTACCTTNITNNMPPKETHPLPPDFNDPGYPSPSTYPSPPDLPGYPSTPGYPSPPEYPSPPAAPGYPPSPDFPSPPEYPTPPAAPGYPPSPDFPSPPEYPTPPAAPGYPFPPDFPSPPEYPSPPAAPGYPSPPDFPSSLGYPPPPAASGYPPPPDFSSQPGYPSPPATPGYPSQPVYPSPPAALVYPSPSDFPSSSGYPPPASPPDYPSPPDLSSPPDIPLLPAAPGYPSPPDVPLPPAPPDYPPPPGFPLPPNVPTATDFPSPTDGNPSPTDGDPSSTAQQGYPLPPDNTSPPAPLGYPSQSTMLSQHQNVEGQTRPPNHVLEKRSIDTELSESYFYAREFSEAIGTELSQLLYEFYLTNALKVAIYKSSESGDDADKSEAFFGEVSIYVKDYVNTDALTDGILSKYDDNPIFSIWDGTANEEKLFSAQLIRLEKTESTGEYVSPVTGKSIVPIYEEDASTYNTNGEVKNFYAKCRGPAPIIITPFIHCPHVRIDPSSFSLRSNGTGIIIEELNLYIDNAMFRRVNNSYVLICLDTFLDAVNQTLNKERYQSKAVSSEIEGIVSFTMSCLSVLCLVLTLLTFMLFPVLRTQPGLNNMFLSVFFIVAYIALVFGSTQTIGSIGCVILGGIIHFCWILVFFWMNVCSIHMFRVFSSLGRQMPSQINVCLTLKYLLYSVGSTTAIMGINIAASFYISNGDSYGYGQMYNGLCYIHYPLMVLVTMALPANIIVISNIIMFLIISMKIRNSSKIQKHTQNERNYFMIYVRLSTITGITWLSSIPMLLTGSPVFAYIFVVLNCCQGIFIFIAFICNRRVVNLYRKMIASAGSAITSNSDTNENTFTLPSSQCSSISIGNRNESTEEFGSNLNMRTINNTSEMLNNATHTRGSMGTRDTTEVFNTKL